MRPIRQDDERFMRLALAEARRGEGKVEPNPMVGAVLVRDGRCIAKGAHRSFGGAHAEIEALSATDPRGATLYVTLEPCAHTGKTPPCVDAILRSGIRRVVIAVKDPNPKVSGRGIGRLRRAGIEVVTGVLSRQAIHLNRPLWTGGFPERPRVILKMAQSLDGAIATRSGQSQWITGAASRRRVQLLRKASDAVLIGIGTALADDPRLNVRLPGAKRQPVKVVLDAKLRLPLGSKMVRSGEAVWIYASRAVSRKSILRYPANVRVIPVREEFPGRLHWRSILRDLGRKGIRHVLIEGGGEVADGALRAGIVDEVYLFIAPILIGGKSAIRSVSGEGIRLLSKATRLKRVDVSRVGRDLLIRGMI